MSTSRRFVTNTTNLVLSGIVILSALGLPSSDELGAYLAACGLAGVTAFLALEITADNQRRNSENVAQHNVAQRLERHVVTASSGPLPLDADRDPIAEFFASQRTLAAPHFRETPARMNVGKRL